MSTDDAKWILAHRGLWNDEREKNSRISILRAIEEGYGVETDLRDSFEKLIISHDSPYGNEIVYFDKTWSKHRFAYNLKSDGLEKYFRPLIENMIDTNSFVFDGSIPEMVKFRKLGIPHALRLSEYEKNLPWPVKTVWIDGFNGDWWIRNREVLSLLQDKHLVFVSPELHGRDHSRAFDWFSELRESDYENFSVCTDYPRALRTLCE